MPLARVTITGADDTTDPDKLADLWEEFSFVEYGILIGSHFGPRFPTVDWIDRMVEARCCTRNAMPLSLHVCGKYLREIAAGRSGLRDLLKWRLNAFDRVQLNWHGDRQHLEVGQSVLDAFCRLDPYGAGWDPEIIFQLDGQNNTLWREASRRFRCSGLFDASHGEGVEPDTWPKALPEIPCGWAGGLGPENLSAQLPRIAEQASSVQDYWVDMETKVRTEDGQQLDLVKVRRCLEAAKVFIEGQR